MTNPFEICSFDEVCEQQSLVFRADRKKKWRMLYPNTGQIDGFPQFGTVLIIATDGVEALFHVDASGEYFRGHLKSFTGPIAKCYVAEEDWDYDNHKRRVRVLRRTDGTMVIIPRDSQSETYWSRFPRMSKEEHELYSKVGIELSIHELDAAIAAINKVVETPRKKSQTQKILDLL